LKVIHPSIHSFQDGERLVLFHIGLFSLVEETHAYLQRKPSVAESGAYSALFPCENGVVFERILTSYLNFQGEEMLILFQIGLFM
jgi:hypothetical protein